MFNDREEDLPGKWFDWTVMALTIITIFLIAHRKQPYKLKKADSWRPTKQSIS